MWSELLSRTLADPKSQTLTVPSILLSNNLSRSTSAANKFSGLRSRWQTSYLCT